MSQDSDLEKTEEASPQRLEKAAEEGQVVRARERVFLVMLGAGLNAGLIAEDVARKRRAEVAYEADFYGSTDGANRCGATR